MLQSEYVKLVQCFSDVDRVIAYPRRSFLSRFSGFRKRLRERPYDMAIDLQGLLKSALVARLARAEKRIGPSFHRECAHLFYHAVAGPSDRDRHAVEEISDVVGHLDLKPAEPEFPVTFPEVPLEAGPPRIGFVPASRWAAKDWRPERFIELAGRLRRDLHASIVLIGGPAEKNICARIEKAAPDAVINYCGRTNLLEMGGLMKELDLVVTVDSGPMHVAAAVGTPVVAIFGPTDPRRTGPYGDRHRIIQSEDLKNHPDLARTFKDKDWAGKWDVPVDEVYEAVVETLVD
ncbi:MAG: glycosyltransferase family 9 protein [Verrucomicrobiota bacterium]